MHTRRFLLPAILGINMALTACKKEAPPAQKTPLPMVTVASPTKQKVMDWDYFTGRLDAVESVNLYSQVTGYLESIHFVDGSEVKKGDLLFQIDPRPFQTVLDQTTALQEQAAVKLELAKNEYERAKALLASKAISAEDHDTKSKAMREAEAGLRVGQASMEKARLDVEYTQIKAPFTGRIGRHLMDVGGLVIGGPMGATMLASVVGQDPIYCYIDADELSVLKYQRLNRDNNSALAAEDRIPAEMALADDTSFPHKGVIDFVDNRLDPSTGTIQTRLVIPNPKPERGQRILQPGYFARVRVPGRGEYEALLIDDKAVGSDQAQKVVMVVGANNIVMPHPVSVGPVIDGMRVIKTGLTEQDRVIVNGMAKVRAGMAVTPLTEEEAAKAQAASAAAQTSPPAKH